MQYLLRIKEPGQKVCYKCSLCTYVTNVKVNGKNHILCKHMAPTNEQCPYCPKMFRNRPSLNSHLTSCRKQQGCIDYPDLENATTDGEDF